MDSEIKEFCDIVAGGTSHFGYSKLIQIGDRWFFETEDFRFGSSSESNYFYRRDKVLTYIALSEVYSITPLTQEERQFFACALEKEKFNLSYGPPPDRYTYETVEEILKDHIWTREYVNCNSIKNP